ncbi:MAG: Smr/MutS family protein [Caldimonas sp.]
MSTLGAIGRALRAREQAAREDVAQAAVRDAAERRERDAFADAVGRVVPLRRPVPHALPRARPDATPRQRQRDEAAALAESLSDAIDPAALIDTDDELSFRRAGIGIDVVRKLRRGVWAQQAQLDLHGLRSDEARERLAAFLRAAARAGLRCVRVVHGKGLGSPGREPVLKAKVKRWLVQRTDVLAFTHARAADGGNGALIVLLDRDQQPPG